MSDELTPIGHVIDSLGVGGSLAEDDLPTAAIVLLKVVEPDGQVRLSIAYSDGLGWIERVGMLAYASTYEQTSD